MRLAAVSIVRNECDIIEPFVRHAAALFDHLYVIDNASGDSTRQILERLAAEGLPLTISYHGDGAYYQGRMTTDLIRRAIAGREWDFIFPIDGDEFVNCDRPTLERQLSTLRTDCAGMMSCDHYVPTESDDQRQLDPVRRIMHRAVTDPPLEPRFLKSIIPGWLAKLPQFSIGEGNHRASLGGKYVQVQASGLRLAHFPVRLKEQFISKVVISRLAWLARSDYDSGMSWHFGKFYEEIKANPELNLSDLKNAALSYISLERNPNTYRNLSTVRDPFVPLYEQLQYTGLVKVSALPRIMEMLELLVRPKTQSRSLPWSMSLTRRT